MLKLGMVDNLETLEARLDELLALEEDERRDCFICHKYPDGTSGILECPIHGFYDGCPFFSKRMDDLWEQIKKIKENQ